MVRPCALFAAALVERRAAAAGVVCGGGRVSEPYNDSWLEEMAQLSTSALAQIVRDAMWGMDSRLHAFSAKTPRALKDAERALAVLEQRVVSDQWVMFLDEPNVDTTIAATRGELGRDTSAAGVDGAASSLGHHEPVGERQGRQPAQDSRPTNSHSRCDL